MNEQTEPGKEQYGSLASGEQILGEEISQLKMQLMSKENLAIVGQLSAGILHEIKNPLSFVNTFSTLSIELLRELSETINKYAPELNENLLEELKDIHDSLQGNIGRVLENGKRAERIILSMLANSREDREIVFEPTDINQMVDEFVKLSYQGMRGQHKDFNLSLITDYEPNLGLVSVVKHELSRVIVNIANNACYALYEKMHQNRTAFKPELRVATFKKEGWLSIVIRDNGTGIPQSIIDKIFNPFFTTKPSSDGTGLGMSLSYDIITNVHKGKLKVTSAEGEYTVFTIEIPVVETR